jgi:hypothetical protein
MDAIPSTSTSTQTARRSTAAGHSPNTTTRLIAKVVREVAKSTRFESYADLTDAARFKLAGLKICYRPFEFNDALWLVETNTTLVANREPRIAVVERVKRRCDVSKPEATDLMRQLPVTLRVMPSVPSPIDIHGAVPQANWGADDRY